MSRIPDIKWTRNDKYALRDDKYDMECAANGAPLETIAYRLKMRHNQPVTPAMVLKAMIKLGYIEEWPISLSHKNNQTRINRKEAR